jgi:hypothetical protein
MSSRSSISIICFGTTAVRLERGGGLFICVATPFAAVFVIDLAVLAAGSSFRRAVLGFAVLGFAVLGFAVLGFAVFGFTLRGVGAGVMRTVLAGGSFVFVLLFVFILLKGPVGDRSLLVPGLMGVFLGVVRTTVLDDI